MTGLGISRAGLLAGPLLHAFEIWAWEYGDRLAQRQRTAETNFRAGA